MRIIIDTNIVFSALLNTNSKIARILFQPKTGFNFYSTSANYISKFLYDLKTEILSEKKQLEFDNLIVKFD